jgi:hypothetical protein
VDSKNHDLYSRVKEVSDNTLKIKKKRPLKAKERNKEEELIMLD